MKRIGNLYDLTPPPQKQQKIEPFGAVKLMIDILMNRVTLAELSKDALPKTVEKMQQLLSRVEDRKIRDDIYVIFLKIVAKADPCIVVEHLKDSSLSNENKERVYYKIQKIIIELKLNYDLPVENKSSKCLFLEGKIDLKFGRPSWDFMIKKNPSLAFNIFKKFIQNKIPLSFPVNGLKNGKELFMRDPQISKKWMEENLQEAIPYIFDLLPHLPLEDRLCWAEKMTYLARNREEGYSIGAFLAKEDPARALRIVKRIAKEAKPQQGIISKIMKENALLLCLFIDPSILLPLDPSLKLLVEAIKEPPQEASDELVQAFMQCELFIRYDLFEKLEVNLALQLLTKSNFADVHDTLEYFSSLAERNPPRGFLDAYSNFYTENQSIDILEELALFSLDQALNLLQLHPSYDMREDRPHFIPKIKMLQSIAIRYREDKPEDRTSLARISELLLQQPIEDSFNAEDPLANSIFDFLVWYDKYFAYSYFGKAKCHIENKQLQMDYTWLVKAAKKLATP